MKAGFIFCLARLFNYRFASTRRDCFRLAEKDLIPEGLHLISTKSFYVSGINKRKIVKVDERGGGVILFLRGKMELEKYWAKVAQGKIWSCNNL